MDSADRLRSWRGRLANLELYCHPVAFFEAFSFSDDRLEGHNVAAVLGKKGCCPFGIANPSGNRNHAPAVGYGVRYLAQGNALFGRNRNEVEWRRAAPVPNVAGKFYLHKGF